MGFVFLQVQTGSEGRAVRLIFSSLKPQLESSGRPKLVLVHLYKQRCGTQVSSEQREGMWVTHFSSEPCTLTMFH